MSQYIYIDIDDTFHSLRIDNHGVEHKFKVIHIYQSYDRNGKKFINEIKMVLVNKAHTNSNDCMRWTIEQIRTVLTENYGNLSNFTIIVSGDGAEYIKTIAKALHALTGLDQWHLFHKIRAICKTQAFRKIAFINDDWINEHCKQNNLAEEIIQLIKDSKIDRAFNLLLEIKAICGNNCKELNDLINYFKHNLKSVAIWSNPAYYGTFTETYCEQLVKCHFGDVGKCYSVRIFMNILKANCLAFLYR